MNAPLSRQFWPLPGGIHPPENKLQSLREPIRKAPMPQRLVIPLTQPGYARPELCVQVGEQVFKGQVIARGTPQTGITCHAPTSGTIVALTEHAVPNPSGLPEPCAVLVPDGRDDWSKLPPITDYDHAEPADLLERIREAGISGLGGAGFPTHTKLRGTSGKVQTLVINACECEPYITADDALMREQAAGIVAGIRILLRLCGAPVCLIGIEDNKPEAVAALQQAITDPRIRLVVIPTRYPSGAEKQLIHILTGIEIPSGSLPLQSGFLCHNVGTALAVMRAVVHGEALVARIVTVTGAALQRPGNLEVLIGTPVADLLQTCEVAADQLHVLVNGGPLMGLRLPHADLPVLKITNCVIAATAAELPPPPPQQACIRCGFCATACPVNLLPQQLYWFARSKEADKAEKHNLMDCIECGACAYVCPSHIPLVQYYRAAKAELRETREKHRMAEHSKARYDFHLARKQEEKALEEQRRAERAAQARQKREQTAEPGTPAATTAAQTEIAAALARVQAKKAARQTAGDQATAVPPADQDQNP